MSGHHNLKFYSNNDNPLCKDCRSAERVKTAYTFKFGAWLCWSKDGSPTEDGCKGFVQDYSGNPLKGEITNVRQTNP